MQQRQQRKKQNNSSGSLMTEEDGIDINGYHDESEPLVEERYASTASAPFINWSVIFDGVPSQHLKLLALICALLALTTVFNIASAKYSLEHQKLLTEGQPNHSADAFVNTNDHTKLLEVQQPIDTLQRLQQLRASSSSSETRSRFDEEEDLLSSRSASVSHGSLEEDLFSSTSAETEAFSDLAVESEAQGGPDEQTRRKRDDLISQYKEGKGKITSSSMWKDGKYDRKGGVAKNNRLTSGDQGDSSGELKSISPNKKERVQGIDSVAEREIPDKERLSDLETQDQMTDDSEKEFFSESTSTTNNIDLEISNSLQQQTVMIQKLQEQLEQQQSMMESLRHKRLVTDNSPQDANAVYSRQGAPANSFGWAPQQQQAIFPQQTASGSWGTPQDSTPYLSQQQQQQQHPGAPPIVSTVGGNAQIYHPQQQPDGTFLMPPTAAVGSTSQMYQYQQQPDGTFVMPPMGAMGSNPQIYNYQQQPDAVMQDSNTAGATTGSAPAYTSDLDTLHGYKDTWDPHENSDTPVFWHVPKAGGSTVKDIMGTCHRMTMASEAGISEGHGDETKIAVVRIGGDPEKGQDPSPFVNVDSTTIAGLKRAKKLGLAQSGLADAIVTTYVYEANDLFDPQHRGRLFSVFRHPVDRAISMFHYLQYADWEPTYNPQLAQMSVEEYAQSGMAENNWLTRTLANRSDDAELSDDDVNKAMDIIRRKFMIGLLSRKEETMERFEKFFGWKYRINPTNQEKCRERLLGSGANANTEHKKEKPKPGSPAYDLLANENMYDIQIYEYVESLFDEQAVFVEGMPDGFRLEGATCCKCGEKPTC